MFPNTIKIVRKSCKRLIKEENKKFTRDVIIFFQWPLIEKIHLEIMYCYMKMFKHEFESKAVERTVFRKIR